jgi:peroxiredoxin
MKLKYWSPGLLLALIAASSLASSGLTGQPAPDFALKSSTGENLRLSEYRGDVVMINFWATWCGPCRQEMPLLDELYMASELGVSFPVLFDAGKDVSRLYAVEAMPATVLVDREGNVRSVYHGYKPGYEQKYLDEIRSLLRE